MGQLVRSLLHQPSPQFELGIHLMISCRPRRSTPRLIRNSHWWLCSQSIPLRLYNIRYCSSYWLRRFLWMWTFLKWACCNLNSSHNVNSSLISGSTVLRDNIDSGTRSYNHKSLTTALSHEGKYSDAHKSNLSSKTLSIHTQYLIGTGSLLPWHLHEVLPAEVRSTSLSQ